jgi:hypothetical protein
MWQNPELQTGAGKLATTTVGWALTVFAPLVVRAAEAMEEALNPTTARARTKLRIAMFFILVFLLSECKKFLKISLDKPDVKNIR